MNYNSSDISLELIMGVSPWMIILLIVIMIILFIIMVTSAISASKIDQGGASNLNTAYKTSVISALTSGIALILVVIVMIIYIMRQPIAGKIHGAFQRGAEHFGTYNE